MTCKTPSGTKKRCESSKAEHCQTAKMFFFFLFFFVSRRASSKLWLFHDGFHTKQHFTLSSASTHHFFTTSPLIILSFWLEWNHFPQDVEQNKYRKTPRCKCHRTSFEASSSDRIRASEVNRNKWMTVILQHYKKFFITLGIPFLAGLRIFLQQQQYKSKTLADQ